ncbi:hypothetical protein ACPUVO_13945 [Pseudocolwellia sp. HL-MZ19]|uniref:hypothetical protein n=1 Tax=Pseudocolwellia sp. HL-MZ19 TaxID=3400846 RepID=UPI003CEEBE2E
MKKIALTLMALSGFSCHSNADNPASFQLEGFKQAYENVHYMAKVKVVNVETIDEKDGSDKHVFSADVLTTLKGESRQHINYEMFVEHGEDATFNETPVYLALCIDDQGKFYWPGTGSQFTPSEEINSWLKQNKDTLANTQSETAWCK